MSAALSAPLGMDEAIEQVAQLMASSYKLENNRYSWGRGEAYILAQRLCEKSGLDFGALYDAANALATRLIFERAFAPGARLRRRHSCTSEKKCKDCRPHKVAQLPIARIGDEVKLAPAHSQECKDARGLSAQACARCPFCKRHKATSTPFKVDRLDHVKTLHWRLHSYTGDRAFDKRFGILS